MTFACIERHRARRAYLRQVETVLAADLAIREIKRVAIRQILDAQRRARLLPQADAIDGRATTSHTVEVKRP